MNLLGKIFSTLFIGALGGGTITGVVQLVNNSNGEVKDSHENQDHSSKKEQKQHPSESDHVSPTKEENKDTFDAEIISLEEIPPKVQEKYPISELSLPNQLEMNDKNSEGDDSIEGEGVALKTKDQENSPTEIDLEVDSGGDFSEQKDSLEEEKPEDLLLKKQKELEQKKKQYEEEIKNRNISLEVVWVNKTDGFAEKACFSLTDKNSEKEIPDIYEMSEDAEDCDDQEGIVSYWSYDKEINGNIEGLWVRGENSKVRELFKKNWDNFSGSEIINKGKKEDYFSSIEIEELLNKEICKIVEKTNKEVGSWLEIECLISQEHINAKQERNKLRNSHTSSNRRS